MLKCKNKLTKFLAAALVVSVCSAMSVPAVYAEGPSGPASDPQIVTRNSQASGPGAAQEAQPDQNLPPSAGQPDQSQLLAVPEQVQPIELPLEVTPPAETLPELPAAEEVQKPEEGKVMSGGRWLDPSKPMIALTFDDGPYAPVGNRIMNCLEQYNGRSTFFVVGNRVASYKSEIKRMHDSGHEVANHTYEHRYLTGLGAGAIRSQIERCSEAIAAVTGQAPKLVRLPGGLKNGTVLENVHYPMIMWNIDTKDWKTRNAQKTIDAVVGKVKDGDIVLMHELYTATGDAALSIIPVLSEQGFQLVTVSEMADFRGGVSAGKLYNHFRP